MCVDRFKFRSCIGAHSRVSKASNREKSGSRRKWWGVSFRETSTASLELTQDTRKRAISMAALKLCSARSQTRFCDHNVAACRWNASITSWHVRMRKHQPSQRSFRPHNHGTFHVGRSSHATIFGTTVTTAPIPLFLLACGMCSHIISDDEGFSNACRARSPFRHSFYRSDKAFIDQHISACKHEAIEVLKPSKYYLFVIIR